MMLSRLSILSVGALSLLAVSSRAQELPPLARAGQLPKVANGVDRAALALPRNSATMGVQPRASSWALTDQVMERLMLDQRSQRLDDKTWEEVTAGEPTSTNLNLDQHVPIHQPLAQRQGNSLDLLPGEPAHEILQLIERAGGSVLEGTLFNVPGGNESFARDRERRRATIVETVRQLQAQDESLATSPASLPAVPAEAKLVVLPDTTAYGVPCQVDDRSAVAELRRASDQLDQAANSLEKQELYDYADQIRETARAMRLAARRMQGDRPESSASEVAPASFQPDAFDADGGATSAVFESPLSPATRLPASSRRTHHADPRELELRELREELEALRERLNSRPAASPVSAPGRYRLEPSASGFESSQTTEAFHGSGLSR